MGYGDKLMAIGDAWASHQRDPKRRKVAIGDGVTLDMTDHDLHWGLDDFLVTPQTLGTEDHPWVISYPGQRPYIDYQTMRTTLERKGQRVLKQRKLVSRLGHYIFDLSYRPTPAPIKLKPEERKIAQAWAAKGPFAILEPHIKAGAPPSKQWPVERFVEAGQRLRNLMPVYQIAAPGRPEIEGFEQIRPSSFREAMAYLKAASLYVGPEGGLHHASAAMGTKAVVIYGGFTSPLITGYDFHENLTGGAAYACGTRYGLCPHCEEAFNAITAHDVVAAAERLLA